MTLNIDTQSEIKCLQNRLESQWLKVKLLSENDEPDSSDLAKCLETIKELEGAIYFVNALEVS